MNTGDFPFHHHSDVEVPVAPDTLFAHLDDHRRLSSHMEKPSLMMAGATMHIDTDALKGQAVGSLIRLSGQVLGWRLAVDEVVTEHEPPTRKTWETRGEPRLLVIGAYRMGFRISARGQGSSLQVFIDYQWPQRGIGRWFGGRLARAYAAWCTQRMAHDAVAAFAGQAHQT